MDELRVEETLARLLGGARVNEQGPDESIRSENAAPVAGAALDHGVRRLGYVIGQELGRGALGRINCATQQVFDREVAVKRLLKNGVDHDASLRFYAEAIITSQLEHPNIVPIHDLLADADGSLQLVMKRVEGVAWKDLLRPRRPEHVKRAEQLSIDDHIEILLKVCDALAFAHGRGILHRDIKPENVMVGAYGEVLLMDWGCGIAFGKSEHHPIVPHIDEITQITGTPSYMAPEMALIRAPTIGPHSDVYQLGAVLYEVLTGKSPHRGKTVLEVLTSAIQGPVADPQLVAPDRFIPEELAAIALAALEKSPKRRIRTVQLFIERLRNYRSHVQAIVLVGTARGQLSLASSNSRLADEALRKATSWAEQALEIWPNWSGAKTVLLDARLASAQHAIQLRSYAVAISQADAAAILAKELERSELAENAEALARKARQSMLSRATRIQRLRIMQIALVCTAVALVVVLASSAWTMHAQLGSLRQQLRDAPAAGPVASDAPLGSAPADAGAALTTDQLQQAMSDHRWSAVSAALDSRISADPDPVQTRALSTGVSLLSRQYQQARAACAQWLALAPSDAHAASLRDLLAGLADNTDLDPDLSAQVAQIFTDLQLPALAGQFVVAPERRLEVFRQRLDAAWPGMGACLSMDDNGRLSASGAAWTAALAHSHVASLAALHGIPLAELDLSHTAVTDLNPLRGMPLENLNLTATQVSDLGPLRGMPLYELDIAQTPVVDLAPLSGAPLHVLMAGQSAIHDGTPLKGRSFSVLDCSGTQLSDLGFLAKTTQHVLRFSGCPITDLTPLTTCTITELDLDGCPVQNALVVARLRIDVFSGTTNADTAALRRIARMEGTRLNLGTAPRLNDLAPLRGMPLSQLIFHGSRVWNLEPLIGMPLTELVCDHSQIASLAPLAGIPLTRLDITGNPITAMDALSKLPLAVLHASQTPMTDAMLHDLERRPIGELWIDHTRITDLGPLATLPLEDVRIGPFSDWHAANIEALRHCASLRFIGVSPMQYLEASEFWRELDTGTLPAAYQR